MKTLVFLVEGKSDQVFLKNFLPRAFPVLRDKGGNFSLRFITFSGKDRLRKNLVHRIRWWNEKNSVFIIVCDQDGGDCHSVKKKLRAQCEKTGKLKDTIVRIACRELENWYLGDLMAVSKVFDAKIAGKYGNKSRFRTHVDDLYGKRELERITNEEYEVISGSRSLAEQIDPDYQQNKSHSFRVFCDKINQIISGGGGTLNQSRKSSLRSPIGVSRMSNRAVGQMSLFDSD